MVVSVSVHPEGCGLFQTALASLSGNDITAIVCDCYFVVSWDLSIKSCHCCMIFDEVFC